MNKNTRIILEIIAILIISLIIFFYDSAFVQYILYYWFFTSLIILPLIWFLGCYLKIKNDIIKGKSWRPFTIISTFMLFLVLTIFSIWMYSNATGMEGIGVLLITFGFIGFLLINLLVQFLMGYLISKKLTF